MTSPCRERMPGASELARLLVDAERQSTPVDRVQRSTRPRDIGFFDLTRPGASFGSSNNSCTRTSKASATAYSIVTVGFATPDSMRLMYVRNMPERSASSSCVTPNAARNCLIRSPKALFGGVRRCGTQRICLWYTHRYTHQFIHFTLSNHSEWQPHRPRKLSRKLK